MPQRSYRPAVRSKIWIEVGRLFAVGDGGIAMWNMGAGYLAGLLLRHATRRSVVRL